MMLVVVEDLYTGPKYIYLMCHILSMFYSSCIPCFSDHKFHCWFHQKISSQFHTHTPAECQKISPLILHQLFLFFFLKNLQYYHISLKIIRYKEFYGNNIYFYMNDSFQVTLHQMKFFLLPFP